MFETNSIDGIVIGTQPRFLSRVLWNLGSWFQEGSTSCGAFRRPSHKYQVPQFTIYIYGTPLLPMKLFSILCSIKGVLEWVTTNIFYMSYIVYVCKVDSRMLGPSLLFRSRLHDAPLFALLQQRFGVLQGLENVQNNQTT